MLKNRKKLTKSLHNYYKSIINFEDSVVIEILKGRKPKYDLVIMCRAIARFEENDRNIVHLMNASDTMKSVEESLELFVVPTILSYKLAKITLFLLTEMEECASAMNIANPIRARVLSFLCALAYRLELSLAGSMNVSATSDDKGKKGIKSKLKALSTKRTKLGSSAKTSINISVGSSRIKYNAKKDLKRSPWIDIDTAIRSIDTDWVEKSKINALELTANLQKVVLKFAKNVATAASLFYDGFNQENQCGFITLKTKEIGLNDRGSSRHKSAFRKEAHIKSGDWADMASLLLEYYQFHVLRKHGAVDKRHFFEEARKVVTQSLVDEWISVITRGLGESAVRMSPLIQIPGHFDYDSRLTIRFVNGSKQEVLKIYDEFKDDFPSFPYSKIQSAEVEDWSRVLQIEAGIASTFIQQT